MKPPNPLTRLSSRSSLRSFTPSPIRPSRSFSSTTSRTATATISIPEDPNTPSQTVPRWKQTPRTMQLPFRVNNSSRQPFPVNDSPERLHAVYDRILGSGGWEALSEETRWLAVTHKSFDQGRRGFNDRLSFLGRRIVELQCSLGLIKAPTLPGKTTSKTTDSDPFARQPFEHADLKGLEGYTQGMKNKMLSVNRIGTLAETYGLESVIRWVPVSTTDYKRQGYYTVLAQSLYAIIGALALERGGHEANKVAREKVLRPLGLHV